MIKRSRKTVAAIKGRAGYQQVALLVKTTDNYAPDPQAYFTTHHDGERKVSLSVDEDLTITLEVLADLRQVLEEAEAFLRESE